MKNDLNDDKKAFQWQSLSPEEKKHQLFIQQKAMLDMFLERGAISQSQYDKSYNALKNKMCQE